eukprot:RCo000580
MATSCGTARKLGRLGVNNIGVNPARSLRRKAGDRLPRRKDFPQLSSQSLSDVSQVVHALLTSRITTRGRKEGEIGKGEEEGMSGKVESAWVCYFLYLRVNQVHFSDWVFDCVCWGMGTEPNAPMIFPLIGMNLFPCCFGAASSW